MQVSNVLKKIFRVVLFFIILLLLLLATSQLFFYLGKKSVGKVQDRNTNITGIQIEEENTIDVLVLGDSESYTSISPMQLFDETGVTSYICGQSAQRVFETYTALEKSLTTQNPKVVLIETNLFYRYKGDEDELKSFEDLQNVFQVFRYHNLWKQAFYGSTDTRCDYKGFVIRDWAHAYDGSYEYMDEGNKTEEKQVKEYVHEYMEKIVSLCQEKDIPILLYSAPSPKCYNKAKHKGLAKFAEKYNVDYIDLNYLVKDLKIDWKKDTADKGDHLNLYGAQKVTSYMGQYLTEHYDLTDHRGTELGEKWEKLVEQYKKDIVKKEEKLF